MEQMQRDVIFLMSDPDARHMPLDNVICLVFMRRFNFCGGRVDIDHSFSNFSPDYSAKGKQKVPFSIFELVKINVSITGRMPFYPI